MSEHLLKMICAECRISPQLSTNSEGEEWCTCPTCGVADTKANAVAEMAAHVTEVSARALQTGIRRSLRGTKGLRFDGKPIPQGSYRFIAELNS